jgi:hypothetical protein
MHSIIMSALTNERMEDKPARLTVLIDAEKKKAFEELCASQDITASQVLRQLIRDYLARHGVPYRPHDSGPG